MQRVIYPSNLRKEETAPEIEFLAGFYHIESQQLTIFYACFMLGKVKYRLEEPLKGLEISSSFLLSFKGQYQKFSSIV